MQVHIIASICTVLLTLFQEHNSGSGDYTIHVVQQSWHTGIILQVDKIPTHIFPEAANYSNHTYIDIGWGDETYYQHPNPGILLGARAILWPTSAVIRVVAFSSNFERYYIKPTLMEIQLTEEQFYQLCRFISESFKRNDNDQVIPSTAIRETDIYFLAKRKYSVFRTCNTWVGLAIKKTGIDVGTFFLVTANQLFRRLNKLENTRYLYNP